MVNYPKLPRFVGQCIRASTCPVPFALLITFSLSVSFFISPAFADEATDLAFIRKANPITTPKKQEIVRFNPRETSELKLAATGLIRLYQKFISTQDGPTCNFVPTCSHFGMACIQEYGMMRGLLLTADRLLRCNGSQSMHYHRDEITGKYLDPISGYKALK